jgi:hypothetical protein
MFPGSKSQEQGTEGEMNEFLKIIDHVMNEEIMTCTNT